MIAKIFGTVLAFLLPLIVFRLLSTETTLAVLALLPLAIMVFLGSFVPKQRRNQAIWNAVLFPSSWTLRWLSGRIKASLLAVFLVVAAVPALAYKALYAQPAEVLVLSLSAVGATLLFSSTQSILRRHVRPEYLTGERLSACAWLAGFVTVVPLFWVQWSFVQIPSWIAGPFLTAMKEAVDSVHVPPGYLEELITAFVLIDHAKTWAQLNIVFVPLQIFAVAGYAATFSFLTTRTALTIAAFFEIFLEEQESL